MAQTFKLVRLYVKNEIVPEQDFGKIVDAIDLYDITQYFISLDTDTWVPSCYWSKFDKQNKPINILEEPRFIGEMMWGVYSYLIEKGFLVIEDKYFGYNSNRVDKYLKKDSYYNTLEEVLYKLVLKRLVNEGYLINIPHSHRKEHFLMFKIGGSYHRQKNLNELIS